MEFRHVVALGSRCRLTHNLRRHWGATDRYPFDWFILTLDGLLRCLEDGLDPGAIYRPELMEEVRDARGGLISVRNRRYGILHHHDFPRVAGDLMGEGWADHLPAAANRFGGLAQRLRAALRSGEPVLLVRERHAEDDPARLAELEAALRALAPGAPLHLLAVNHRQDRVPAGLEAITVEEVPGHGWRGDEAAWSAALAATGHRPLDSAAALP